MKKEEMLQRLQLIEADLNQTMANWNALTGAKNECTHWLKQLEAEEKAALEEKPVEVVLDVDPKPEEAREDCCNP